MAQTPAGARKSMAKRLGVTVEFIESMLASEMKWCVGHKDWHSRSEFSIDRGRGDGLATACRSWNNDAGRAKYQPIPRPQPGRRYVAARDGDGKQARRRVNHLVDVGILPRPNSLPCTDCGHLWTEGCGVPHEYDHYLGYAAEHHEHVQAVCAPCHYERDHRRSRNG